MSVSRLSRQSIQAGFPKQQSIWDGITQPAAMDPLGVVTLTSTASSVTFLGIPATYTHLQIRGFFNQGASNWLSINYNNDSTAGAYQWHYPATDGSTVASGWSGSTSANGTVIAYNNNATAFGGFICDILDYSSGSKTKVGRSLSGYDANGSGELMLISNMWNNTSAINRITLTGSGTLAVNSSFALYGIK